MAFSYFRDEEEKKKFLDNIRQQSIESRQEEHNRLEAIKNVKWTEPDKVSPTVNLTKVFKDRYGENSTQYKNMQRQANLVNYGKENPTIWDRIKVVANETLHNAQKITGNLGYGASSGMKQSVNYLENVNEQNIPGYREKRNAQYLASTKVNDIDKAQFKTATSIFNKNDIEKPETNLIKKSITESIQEDNRKIQENIENTTDPISKKIAELAPSIGQMGVGSVLSSVNPALGIGYFTTSAGGGYIDEAKQRGMDDKQAYQYGTVMGAVEGITEAVGVENFKKAGTGIKTLVTGTGKEVGKEVAKKSIKTVLKDYGIGIADNFMQEAIIEPIQEAVATGVAGKEKADWNDIGGRMLKSGIDGALTAMITGGAELGVQSCVGVVEKINNGQQPTQQEISQSIQDAQKNGVKVENSIQHGIQQAINSQQQEQKSLKKTIDNKLQNELNKNGDFSNQLELYKSGKMKSSDLLYLGDTPNIYKQIGLKENPITMLQGKLKDIISEEISDTSHKHGVPIETLKNLPKALKKPLNILKSKNNNGEDCIVVITDLADLKERPIITSIQINDDGQIGNIHFDTNRVSSVYGKRNYDDYMTRQIEAGNMIYDIDEGIIKESPTSTGLQLSKGLDSFSINNSISQNNENVNTINTKYMQKEGNNTQQIQSQVKEQRTPPIQKNSKNSDNILNDAKVFFEDSVYKDIEDNKDVFKDLSEKEIKEGLKNLYQNQLEEQLNSIETYKDNDNRKQTYMKYKNKKTEYNGDILNKALESVKTNRNGKRTVNQWIEVAKQIGQNAGELNSKQIQDLAYGSWFDLKPNTKNSITRYDNVSKTNLPFQKFSSDEWVNTIYENAKNSKMQQFEEVLNKKVSVNKELTPPIKNEIKPTKGEVVDYSQMEKPEGKIRKHYKSIIESSNTTAEAKKVAKEMMGLDTYTPQSNETLLQRADSRINNSNPDAELNSLLSKAMNSEKISDVDIAVGERLIEYYSKTGNKENLQDAIHATAMAGTQAGRATQALALLNHATPQGQVTWLQRSIDKVNNELQQKYRNKKNIPQFELTSEMTDKVLNTKSEKEMYKVLDDVYEELGKQVPKTHLEQIDEWRYFSMLANIKTHGRNLIGNLAMNKIQKAKNKVAGAIEGTVAKFNPEMERTHTLKRASKETRAFAKQDVKNMDVQTQLGMNENKYNPQSRLQNARITFKNKALNNTVGKLFDLNSNLLEVEDNIGLKSMYVSALSEYITANNIDVNNITDAELGKARKHAIKEAQEATFHQASALATALNQMGRKNAITKFALDSAVPFKKTPINVAKTGVQYSPAGLIKSAIFDTVKLRKGNISVNQYIDNISKGLTGTGITYMGYVLAEAGLLKASGSDDDKKEQYEEEQGKQSYSIEINGKTYSLDWLSPAGVPLFIGAEINQQFNQSKKEKNSKSNDENEILNQALKKAGDIENSIANALNPVSEMSMVSGLHNLLSSFNKENATGELVVSLGKSYINQFVPTALGQVARTGDEYERTTKSTKTGSVEKAIDQTINQIKSKIPGLRQTLPVKTDIWGQDVKQPTNLPLRAFRNFINPSTVKDVSTDKVDKELNELYSKTGESSILPKAIEKTFKINGTDYRMTDDEYAKYYKKYGETSYQLIEGFIGSSDYKNLAEQQKIKSLEKVYEYAKEKNKIDYANTNDIKVEKETTSLYNIMNELKTKVKQGEYLNYLAKTDGIEKDIEKNNILANSNYSASTKKVIYQNGTGKQDKFYNEASNREIDINEYLKYKIADSNNEFNSDKYENGKTISGSAKNKRFNWVNSNITNPNERLMILGYSYKLSNNERENLIRYIKDTSSNEEEVIERLKLFSSNFTYNNGKIYYK